MTYSRVEKPSADPEPHPSVHRQRKAKCNADVQQSREFVFVVPASVRHLSARESEKEEEEGPDEFAAACDEVVSCIVW